MASSNHLNAMFKAFADETRLRILHLLSIREMCVGDLVRILRVPQPTASRHLGYLRRAGLVEDRKEGLWVHYSLADARSDFHHRLIDCVRCCFDEVPELAADAKRAARLATQGGCCPEPSMLTTQSADKKR
ncbi:MAG: ArsR/SmtB family transcription factor [Planctomycetota bacterium]|jgi:ArsR family transcriptional regulator